MTDGPAPHVAVFVYGTLCHPPLIEAVLGHEVALSPARLPGYRVAKLAGESYPGIVREDGAEARGMVVRGLTTGDLARLDFYELGVGYDRVGAVVQTADGPVEAVFYLATDAQPPLEGAWDMDAWAATHGPIAVAAAREFMAHMGRMPAEAAMARYPQMLMRAGSALRAAAEPAPRAVRSAMEAAEVMVDDEARPYTGFFALREHVLRFPRFDGSLSAPVRRAGFAMGDAVTVLPYDPVRDRVLLIEQFRYGPYLRGDPRPWCLEPVAGRIDPGESPEEAARREAVEETGLRLGALHRVGGYYPSPGAVTEWLISYVGLADLPDGVATIGGVQDEAEDIKGHLLGFDALMGLLDTEEAANGPLILSALWLARAREGLRAAAG